jgi:Beta-propeller repeat
MSLYDPDYSGNAIRRTIAFVMVLVGLLQTPAGPFYSGSRPKLPTLPHAALTARGADPHSKDRAREAFSRLPLRFEENTGQTDAEVKFLSRGNGYNLFLTPSEAVMALRDGEKAGQAGRQSVVRMKLVGANSAPRIEGLEALPGKSNYLVGNAPGRWRRNVVSYARVRYQGVYPGIDMIYYGNQQEIEYDFAVMPGADPKNIKLKFDGVEKMRVDAQGELVLQTRAGDVRQRKPIAYQEVAGRRQEIAVNYVQKGDREIGFNLGEYDRARRLVIDPVVVYATYLGGNIEDLIHDIAVDGTGCVYVTGETQSSRFPQVNPLPLPPGQRPSSINAFVAKLSRDGSELISSTVLGGGDYDRGYGIALDDAGNIYVVGTTLSEDFPIQNALQSQNAGYEDVFISKIRADGSAFVYSTYLGGNSSDVGTRVAVDKEGNVYLAGTAFSTNFPIKNAVQPQKPGDIVAFVSKIKADGSGLVYSTYLGGSDDRYAFFIDIAADLHGNAYITGATSSTDFPTVNALQPTLNGFEDAFVTKLDARGAFAYSTYLGGSDGDAGFSIAVDAGGNAYLTGRTRSTDFPRVNPISSSLTSNVFVSKLNPTGSALCYSTYLSGAESALARKIAVDSQGQVYVTGSMSSRNLLTRAAVQPVPDRRSNSGSEYAFVVKLSAAGSKIILSTYLGGHSSDVGTGIAIDKWENAYVAGHTRSRDFPATAGAFQRECPFECIFGRGFIVKIDTRHRQHENPDLDQNPEAPAQDRRK